MTGMSGSKNQAWHSCKCETICNIVCWHPVQKYSSCGSQNMDTHSKKKIENTTTIDGTALKDRQTHGTEDNL
jgi:hypothetical protein